MKGLTEYQLKKLSMYILMLDKGTGPIDERFELLRKAIQTFVCALENGFISQNSEEFKDYLEGTVGRVIFTKPFAIRIRNGETRLFINGREILGEEN